MRTTLTARPCDFKLALMGWHVKKGDASSGPYDKTEIIKRIADGNIGRSAMVREDPTTEWQPIESSIFKEAFGAANPYANPELIAPKRPRSLQLGAWVPLVALGLFLGVFRGYLLGPRNAQNGDQYALFRLGAIVVMIGFAYLFTRMKRKS